MSKNEHVEEQEFSNLTLVAFVGAIYTWVALGYALYPLMAINWSWRMRSRRREDWLSTAFLDYGAVGTWGLTFAIVGVVALIQDNLPLASVSGLGYLIGMEAFQRLLRSWPEGPQLW